VIETHPEELGLNKIKELIKQDKTLLGKGQIQTDALLSIKIVKGNKACKIVLWNRPVHLTMKVIFRIKVMIFQAWLINLCAREMMICRLIYIEAKCMRLPNILSFEPFYLNNRFRRSRVENFY
jgi:hypothetical protein